MYAVSLVEVSLRGDSFEKKWNERNAIVLGQVCIHRLKRVRVLGTVIGRQFHAGEDHCGPASHEALNDLLEVGARLGEVQPAQAVIAAELQNHDVGFAFQDPVHPAQSTGRRLAADASVDRSEEHTSELQSLAYLVCRLLLE